MKQVKLKRTGNNIEKNIKNPRAILHFQNMVFDLMAQFAPNYSGGQWDFLKTGNGGFYMRAPNSNKIVKVKTLYSQTPIKMSIEALSLCINYMVLESLSNYLQDQHISDLAIKLRMDMFNYHAEANAMYNFLD